MSVAVIESGRLRLTAVLEIDGLESQWYLGRVAPPAPSGRVMRPGIIDISPVTEQLDMVRGIPSSSSVTVRVAGADELMRLAPTGGGVSSILTTTLPGVQAVAAVTMEVEDTTGFAVPGIVHIGREAIEVDAILSATELRIPIGGRGALGTLIQPHVAQPVNGWTPRVYSRCVTWRHRTARILVGELGEAGWLGAGPVVEVDGRITGLAAERDGVIELQLETLAGALDAELGASDRTETVLQRGGHYFDPGAGSIFAPAQLVWESGAMFSRALTAAVNDVTIASPTGVLGQVVRFAAGETIALIAAPVLPRLVVNDATPGPDGSEDPTGVLDVDAPGWSYSTPRGHNNERLAVIPEFALGPGWQDWPARLDAANVAFADPATGSPWASISVDAGSATMTITPRWNAASPGPMRVRSIAGMGLTDTRYCDAVYAEPDGPRPYDPALLGRANQLGRLPNTEVTSEPVTLRLGGVALAWWQRGERYMYVRNSIAPGASDAAPVLVRVEGRDVEGVVRVVEETAAPAPRIGFLLRLHVDDVRILPSVLDVPGEDRPTLRAVAGGRRVAVGALVRSLLTSVAGTGANGASDVLPYGAALRDDTVDSPIGGGPGLLGPRTLLLLDAQSAGDVLSDIMRSEGTLLVPRLRRATRRRVLSITSGGLPSPTQVVATIADGDWLADGRPVLGIDSRLVNVVVFELDARTQGQAGLLRDAEDYTVTVTDLDSASEHGGREPETIRLVGVELDPDDPAGVREALVPLAQARFGAYGYPRRVVAGSVTYAVGVALDVGAVVRLRARELRGYDGAPVSEVVARITSVERDVMGARCAIEATYYQSRTAGWAPGARITAEGADNVTVAANDLSRALSPGGVAQTDAGFFAAGDEVRLVPRGRYEDTVTRTVLSVVGNVITLTAGIPAGFVGGGVRPATYTAAAARLRDFAWLAPIVDAPHVYT